MKLQSIFNLNKIIVFGITLTIIGIMFDDLWLLHSIGILIITVSCLYHVSHWNKNSTISNIFASLWILLFILSLVYQKTMVEY